MATTMVESSNIADDQANNNETDNETAVKVEKDCDERSNDSNDATDNNGTSNDSNEKTNLIVNYLPQQMSDQDFENLFKKFGSMKSCKIVRNRVSGYSYGFGFVDFETHDQALQAIEELNGHELENKKIKVAFARPAGQDIKQANLYIKNVPDGWGQDELKNVFDPYGNIIQIRVLGNNRGVAFVLYDLRKQAEDALEALNGTTPEGCEKPLEIKFAADKKAEKGGNKNKNNNNNNNNNNSNNNSNGGGNSGRHRERGSRGGRNQNQRNQQNRQGRNQNQRSFFDRQNNNFDDRKGNRGGQGSYNNSNSYGGGNQYSNNYNSNGVGPMRPVPSTRMNRYAPFVPIQQPMDPSTMAAQTASQMTPQMTANPAYGFASQQQMIPFAMMQTPQMNPMQQMAGQPGQQLAQGAMGMYAAPMTMGFTPVQQNQMNSLYNVGAGGVNPAATMQAPMNQTPAQMGRIVGHTPNGPSSGSGSSNDDGITLFVYNIGPDSDENELRGMFSPYGHVVKCNVVRKTPGGETKGFGFVTMSTRDQANSAISGLNGSMRNGRALQVSLKK